MLCNPDCLIEWREVPPPRYKKDWPGTFVRVPRFDDYLRRHEHPGSNLPPDGSVCLLSRRVTGEGEPVCILHWHCPGCLHCHETRIPDAWLAEGKAHFVEPAGLADASWATDDAHPPVLYLATAYTHADAARRGARANLASECAAWLMGRGWNVISPVSMGHAIGCAARAGVIPPDFARWREVCLRLLEASDALVVLMLDGLSTSVGLAAEIDHARKLGLPLNQIKLPGEEAAQRGEPFEVVPRPQWWR